MNGPRWLWWSSVGLAVLAFVLGFVGFCEKDCKTCDYNVVGRDWLTHFHALHATLQLYVLNYSAGDIQTKPMGFAALLAPLSIGSAVVYALSERIVKTRIAARLRFGGCDHMFIGAGRRASQIAIAKARWLPEGRRLRIGTLDPKGATLFRERLDRLRWRSRSHRGYFRGRLTLLTVEGNGLERASLSLASAHKARTVWVMTSDDTLNLAIGRRLLQFTTPVSAEKMVGAWTGQHLIVRVSDTRLVRADHALYGEPDDSRAVEYLNIGRLVARELFATFPPCVPPLTAMHDEAATLPLERRPHIALIGDGDLIEAIAVYTATHWVLDERRERCVRVTLVGRDASRTRDRLLVDHPALCREDGEWTDLAYEYRQFVQFVVLDLASDEIEPHQWRSLQEQVPFDAVYVSTNSDLSTARAAMRVRMLRDAYPADPAVPVVALRRQTSPTIDAPRTPAVEWFDIYTRLFCNDDAYPGEKLDIEAILINRAYQHPRRILRDENVTTGPIEWSGSTSDPLKWSSRYSAAHVAVKVALLARGGADVKTPGHLLRALLVHRHALARLEHRRFVAERLIDGWLLDPELTDAAGRREDDPTRKKRRLNATLVPHDALSVKLKNIDRRIVLSIPAIQLGSARRSKAPGPDGHDG